MNFNETNNIVVYFSKTGENYVQGKIQNIEVGNTSIIASYIQELITTDIFEIKTKENYPSGYHETTVIAKKELQEQIYPKLVGIWILSITMMSSL